MSKYTTLPTLGLIALVCIIAGVLGGMHVLPSEAVTAILGGAVAQAVSMIRGTGKTGGSVPPPPAVPTGEGQKTEEAGAPPAATPHLSAGTAVGMLAGALAPHFMMMAM